MKARLIDMVYVEMDETLQQAALRELREETSIIPEIIAPFGVYDSVSRDPRRRTITHVFQAASVHKKPEFRPGDDADPSGGGWFHLRDVHLKGFDHNQIFLDWAKDKGL